MTLLKLGTIPKQDIVAAVINGILEAALCATPWYVKWGVKGVKAVDKHVSKKIFGVSFFDRGTYWLTTCIFAADIKEQRQIQAAVQEMPVEEIGKIVKVKMAQFPEALSSGERGKDVYEAIYDAVLAFRAETPDAACRSLNERRRARGLEPLTPQKLSREEKAAGRLVAKSLLQPRPQSRADSSSRPLPDNIPGYRLTRFLGEGGFGEVFLAKHEATGSWRAVKIGDAIHLRRVDREIRIMQTFNHPHLVRYYEDGLLPGDKKYWMAMDYAGEWNLAQLLENDEKRPTVDAALTFAEKILVGLAALHEKQIIHRDLKPQNVMVDGSLHLRLIDFGFAKAIRPDGSKSSKLTQKGDTIGTPQYMSPEQARGRDVATSTDVWSFGAVLFELLTGTALFQGESVLDIYMQIGADGKVAIDHERIPPEFRPFLERCLERDPAIRFDDAIVALEQFREAASECHRRLRHERYRERWIPVLEKGLLEQFAATHRGQLPPKALSAFHDFCKEHGVNGSVDLERLKEILPVIFVAQASVQQARRKLGILVQKFEATPIEPMVEEVRGKLRTAKETLQAEMMQLSSKEIDDRNLEIGNLEKEIEDTLAVETHQRQAQVLDIEYEIEQAEKKVHDECHRMLAGEVAIWKHRERLDREKREAALQAKKNQSRLTREHAQAQRTEAEARRDALIKWLGPHPWLISACFIAPVLLYCMCLGYFGTTNKKDAPKAGPTDAIGTGKQQAPDIVGNWEEVRGEYVCPWEFRADGTGKRGPDIARGLPDNFVYRQSGNELTITFTDGRITENIGTVRVSRTGDTMRWDEIRSGGLASRTLRKIRSPPPDANAGKSEKIWANVINVKGSKVTYVRLAKGEKTGPEITLPVATNAVVANIKYPGNIKSPESSGAGDNIVDGIKNSMFTDLPKDGIDGLLTILNGTVTMV